jgi:Tfp pilus assembly protein PilF
MAYADMDDNQKAIKDYSKAIEMKPNDPKALFHRALSYTVTGQHHKAIKDYTAAIAAGKDNYEAITSRALLYRSVCERALCQFCCGAVTPVPDYVCAGN